MDRAKFLQQLNSALATAPQEEREAALQYYTMYFEDAGPDAEQQVLEELGSPQKVAQDILSGAEGTEAVWAPPAAKAQTKEQPAENAAVPTGPQLTLTPGLPGGTEGQQAQQPTAPPTSAPPPGSIYNTGGPAPQGAAAPVKERDNTKIILIIVLAVVLSPLWGGLLAALVSLIISAIIVLAVPVIIGVSFCAASIGMIIASVYLMPFSVPNGLFLLGVSILLLGLGLLAIYGGCVLLGKVVPAIFRGIASLFRNLFGRRRATV